MGAEGGGGGLQQATRRGLFEVTTSGLFEGNRVDGAAPGGRGQGRHSWQHSRVLVTSDWPFSWMKHQGARGRAPACWTSPHPSRHPQQSEHPPEGASQGL